MAKASDAREAWRLMFDFFMRSAPVRMESLRARGLTPNDARTLFALESDEGIPIGVLAREWNCDPSTATALVDRLVRARLIERGPSPTDRRVNLIRLTPAGAATKKELMGEYYRPPPEFMKLSAAEISKLDAILRKLIGDV